MRGGETVATVPVYVGMLESPRRRKPQLVPPPCLLPGGTVGVFLLDRTLPICTNYTKLIQCCQGLYELRVYDIVR